MFCFLFFKQKTAYEMRISDWSSDVCSSDLWDQALLKGLAAAAPPAIAAPPVHVPERLPAIHPEPLELLVRPDPTVWDGRFGNNPWAQELPKPVTTLTWDNAVLISPALAARHDLENADEVRLVGGTGSLTGPVWVMPGQASETILVHRGYGRRFGEVASGAGFDLSPMLASGRVSRGPTGDRRGVVSGRRV